MSLEEYARELKVLPEVHSGIQASVQWLDGQGMWLITVTEPYRTESGEYELGPVWQKKYGEGEAPTAYAALMLGLSDRRQGL